MKIINIFCVLFLTNLSSCVSVKDSFIEINESVYADFEQNEYKVTEKWNRLYNFKSLNERDRSAGAIVNCSINEYNCFEGLFRFSVNESKINNNEVYIDRGYEYTPICLYLVDGICNLSVIKYLTWDDFKQEGYFVYEKDFGIRSIAFYKKEWNVHRVLHYKSGPPLLGPSFVINSQVDKKPLTN